MTSELLSSIAGVVLSLVFSYVPGVSDWYDALNPTTKRLVMVGLLVLVAAGAFGLACAGVDVGVTCSGTGVWDLLKLLFAAITANQSAYFLSPKRAKLSR